jgi:two-component system, OmpR family, response regulator QseB
MRILLVEDDELLGDGVCTGLKLYHHTVDWVKNGAAALQAVQGEHFDLMILDLNIPQISGEEVLKALRANNVHIPIIILTAKSSIDERIAGLDLGADDFVTKPFAIEELGARIRSVVRRSADRAHPSITIGDITLDPAAHTITKSGQILDFSRREFALLQVLLENAGKVVPRNQLAQSIYGWADEVDSNALEVHVHNIRKKLGAHSIKTVRGIGYIFRKADE